MPRDEYLTKLDSLARFYNSQMIAHVGYLLTTLVFFVSVFSVLGDWMPSLWRLPLFFVLLIAFLLYPFPAQSWGTLRYLSYLTPVFHYARMRYYMVLTEAVWLHMGLKTPDSDPDYRLLRARANKLGVESAVITWFEARLYVSLSRWKVSSQFELKKEELKLIEAEKDDPQLRLLDEQLREGKLSVDEYLKRRPLRPVAIFRLEGYIKTVGTLGRSYEGGFLQMQNRLLLLAYRHMLKAHSTKGTLWDAEIYALFQPFVD
jgi:hypothetical protein